MNKKKQETISVVTDVSETISIPVKEIRGKRYGSRPVIVSLGGTTVNGFAVMCGMDRWVSTQEDCIHWLCNHGLNENEADLLISLGEALDKLEVPSLEVQEKQGQLDEELQKLIDTTIMDIRAGRLNTRDKAISWIESCARESSYAHNILLANYILSNTAPFRGAVLNLAASVLTALAIERLIRTSSFLCLK